MARTIDQAGERRSSAVESLRALAALGVLEGHVFNSSQAYGSGAHATLWDRTLLGGGFGVYLFFALTGYLLFRPFARRDFGTGDAVDYKRYAANRVFRILPLYYVVLIVYVLTIDHGGSFTIWWQSLLLLENFVPSTLYHIDGVMWSLVVEVQFYVLLPFLALGLSRLAAGSARLAALGLVGVGTVSEILRLATVTTVHVVDPRWEYSLPATFVFFVPGMLLALVEARWTWWEPYLGGWARRGTLWFVAALPLWFGVFWRYNLDILIVPAAFLMVGSITLPLIQGTVRRALDWRPLAALGVASYSLYLWHFPIVSRLGIASWAPHDYLGLLALGLPLCCAVALVSYRVVEEPFLRLRRAWSPASAPQRASNAPELGVT